MTLRKTLMLAAIVAALSGATAATAAEDKAPVKEGAAAEKALPEKAKKVMRHDHGSFHKSGLETQPAGKPSEAPGASKGPAHDHKEFHK